jgi:branched-subunit amino acid transport protein
MDQTAILVTILGMAGVTYAPRLLPIWWLSSRSIPESVVLWLRYVPVAVLAAMLFPAVMVSEGGLDLELGNLFLAAAFPTGLVAWKTRSLFGSVLTGMTVVALGRALLGS